MTAKLFIDGVEVGQVRDFEVTSLLHDQGPWHNCTPSEGLTIDYAELQTELARVMAASMDVFKQEVEALERRLLQTFVLTPLCDWVDGWLSSGRGWKQVYRSKGRNRGKRVKLIRS